MIEIPLIHLPFMISFLFAIVAFVLNGFSFDDFKTDAAFFCASVSTILGIIALGIYAIVCLIWLIQHVKIV